MKRLAMVHSKEKEGAQEVIVLLYKNQNEIMVKTKQGMICSAIDNPFTGLLYVDDIYGVYGKAVER